MLKRTMKTIGETISERTRTRQRIENLWLKICPIYPVPSDSRPSCVRCSSYPSPTPAKCVLWRLHKKEGRDGLASVRRALSLPGKRVDVMSRSSDSSSPIWTTDDCCLPQDDLASLLFFLVLGASSQSFVLEWQNEVQAWQGSGSWQEGVYGGGGDTPKYSTSRSSSSSSI